MSLTPVLLVSYYFPPHGGAGTQRFAKFAKYLPLYGYKPVVVTTHEELRSGSAPVQDRSMVDEVGNETVVIRTPAGSGAKLPIKTRLALAAKFRIDGEEWAAAAEETVVRAGREHGCRAAVVTVSPYANWTLGRAVGRDLAIPWALDLRDPWTLDPWREFTTPLHLRRDMGVMKRALRSADAVVANTPRAASAFTALAGLDRNRVFTIPNGFDQDDFAQARDDRKERFTIVHTGWLHSCETPHRPFKHLLRTGVYKTDFTGRSARYLFEAVARLRSARPDLYRLLSIELVGTVHPSHRDLASRLGIGESITERGYVPHREAVAAMMDADCVFLPLHGTPGGPGELIVPGKVYEALASGTFVLACLPEGDAAELVRMTRAGVVCPPQDVDGLAKALEEAVDAWRGGRAPRGADVDRTSAFSRPQLTRRLAGVLDFLKGTADAGPRDDPWMETASGAGPTAVPDAQSQMKAHAELL